MGEGEARAGSRYGALALLACLVLAVSSLVSATDPDEAFACPAVQNPDGSWSCTLSFSDVPCPSATGSINAITSYAIHYVPVAATVVGHTLEISPPCPNSTISEISFEDNATTQNPDGSFPSPPAGEKTVRVVYKVTCDTNPCGSVANPTTSFDVDYTLPTDPGGGGGGGGGGGDGTPAAPGSPPDPDAVDLPKKLKVDVRSGDYLVEDLLEIDKDPHGFSVQLITFFEQAGFPGIGSGAHKQAAAARKPKLIKGGTLGGTLKPGERGTLVGHLNGKARKALREAGKLKVVAKGALTNSAGTTPFAARLIFVAKGAK